MLLGLNFWLVFIIGLASFRLTRLVVFDKITEFIRAPFLDERIETDENGIEQIYLIPKEKGIKRFFGELISCYWCTGLWMSALLLALFFFFPIIGEPIILLLAVAAVGSIIETIISSVIGN